MNTEFLKRCQAVAVAYASRNPKWTYDGKRQDPSGVHALVAEIEAMLAGPPEANRIVEPKPDDLLTVAHITRDGNTLTLEFGQLGDLASLITEGEFDDEGRNTYELRIAPMRRDEFEALGDFNGF